MYGLNWVPQPWDPVTDLRSSLRVLCSSRLCPEQPEEHMQSWTWASISPLPQVGKGASSRWAGLDFPSLQQMGLAGFPNPSHFLRPFASNDMWLRRAMLSPLAHPGDLFLCPPLNTQRSSRLIRSVYKDVRILTFSQQGRSLGRITHVTGPKVKAVMGPESSPSQGS